MVVHAGAGAHSGTLTNALVHRFGALSQLGGELRPGIVHRLDRYTSGVILVARNDAAHQALARQFATRTVEKIYLALVHGTDRKRRGPHYVAHRARPRPPDTHDHARCHRAAAPSPATRFCAGFDKFTYVEVKIGTGRTHQIRVHLASIGHPVAGDKLYGAPTAGEYGRYFLHAARIAFTSPQSGERVMVEAPLAPELSEWLSQII